MLAKRETSDEEWRGDRLASGSRNPIGAPPSFYSGAVLAHEEAALAVELVVDPKDPNDAEDAAAKARKIRMEVSLSVSGALGSFAAPGLFDQLEGDNGELGDAPPPHGDVLAKKSGAILPPDEHDVELRKQHVPAAAPKSLEFSIFGRRRRNYPRRRDLHRRATATEDRRRRYCRLRKKSSAPRLSASKSFREARFGCCYAGVALVPTPHDLLCGRRPRSENASPDARRRLSQVKRTPLLLPFPTVTRKRSLHGAKLPVAPRLRLPRSATDDSVAPPGPGERRALAAVGIARDRNRIPRDEMRDPRKATKRHRELLGVLGYPPTREQRRRAFDFPEPDALKETSRTLAGPYARRRRRLLAFRPSPPPRTVAAGINTS